MSLRTSCVIVLSLLSTTLLTAAEGIDPAFAATEAAGPLEIVPEAYRPSELGERYLDDSRTYLKDHPGSPFAARMLFDMLQVACELELEETADDCRAELMIAHPKSRQCRWLLKTFHGPEDFRTSLLAAVESRPWGSELSATLSPLFEVGLEQWPDSLIGKPGPVLFLAVLASVYEPSFEIDQAIDAMLYRQP
jgi:hypothetical protein